MTPINSPSCLATIHLLHWLVVWDKNWRSWYPDKQGGGACIWRLISIRQKSRAWLVSSSRLASSASVLVWYIQWKCWTRGDSFTPETHLSSGDNHVHSQWCAPHFLWPSQIHSMTHDTTVIHTGSSNLPSQQSTSNQELGHSAEQGGGGNWRVSKWGFRLGK